MSDVTSGYLIQSFAQETSESESDSENAYTTEFIPESSEGVLHISVPYDNGDTVITLSDTIVYQNLEPGKSYTVTGKMIEKQDTVSVQTETDAGFYTSLMPHFLSIIVFCAVMLFALFSIKVIKSMLGISKVSYKKIHHDDENDAQNLDFSQDISAFDDAAYDLSQFFDDNTIMHETRLNGEVIKK